MTTKNITEHYKKYGVIEGDKLLLETAKNNYQKGYDEAKKEADELEKEKEMYSQVIIELEKKLQTQKSELIKNIKSEWRKKVQRMEFMSGQVAVFELEGLIDKIIGEKQC